MLTTPIQDSCLICASCVEEFEAVNWDIVVFYSCCQIRFGAEASERSRVRGKERVVDIFQSINSGSSSRNAVLVVSG